MMGLSGKPEIGKMEPGDYGQVLALWKNSEDLGLGEADSAENFQRNLQRNPGLSLVAREKGAIIGAVLCGHDGRRGYLHHLAVNRKHRKKGIGRALVEGCLERLRKLGIGKFHIFIFSGNKSGGRFWSALGWGKRPELRIMSIEIPPENESGNWEGGINLVF